MDRRVARAAGSVLVVDDDEGVRDIIAEQLRDAGFHVREAANAEHALRSIERELPDVILLDVHMPGMNGIELCARLKNDPRTQLLPVVLLTAQYDLERRVAGLEAGADDFFSKPWEALELKSRVRSLMRLKQLVDDLEQAEAVMTGLGLTLEARDGYTSGHCLRLARYATQIGRRIGVDQTQLKALYLGGFLHDLGKIATPDAVLRKPGPLTEEERGVMKRHPEAGEKIVLPMRTLAAVRPIIRHHHERWDGGGYPDGLAGEAIPFLARVVGLADAYDALRTARPYKPAWSHDRTLATLREETDAGKWDPDVLEALIETVGDESAPETTRRAGDPR